ncbi:MAG: methionyl-tRNA formyltransferase, partial [Miltoncostaeaceae bacterium]
MKIAFAGSPAAAATVLRHLDASDHDIRVVVTQPDRRRGRSGRPRPTVVGQLAHERGLHLLRPSSINDDEVLDEFRARGVGALAVVAFGQILREPLLSEWPCLNVHFSLLPAYRGAAPVERALIDGVAETGVTIMRMDEGLDTGPTIATRPLPVGPPDTGGEVTERLADLGAPALVEALSAVEADRLVVKPQPEEGVSLAPRIVAEDRALDPSRTAEEVANRIRALAPHIGATLVIDGEPFKI